MNPSVFISYSHSSLAHVKWVIGIAQSLVLDGVTVVIDQWNLREGQDVHAFMERMVCDPSISRVLIISDEKYAQKANTRAGGVGIEAQIISPDIYSRTAQTKFVPIVTSRSEGGDPYLPVFLRNRLWVDLSSDETFRGEYEKLLDIIYGRRDPIDTNPAMTHDATVSPSILADDLADRLEQFANEYPSLITARLELGARGGISYASIEGVASSPVPPRLTEKWWLWLAQSNPGAARYCVAVSATVLLDKRGIGREAITYCLENDHLDQCHRDLLGAHLTNLTSRAEILWAHSELVSRVCAGDVYYEFLRQHTTVIAEEAYEEMISYLLAKERGPGESNVYSLFHICSHVTHCQPFVERWCEWILTGQFDTEADGGEDPDVLYRLLNEGVERDVGVLDRVIEVALRRMFIFVRAADEKDVRIGLRHLRSMVTQRFKAASRAFPDLDSSVHVRRYDSLVKERSLFSSLRGLLKSVVTGRSAKVTMASDHALEEQVRKLPFAEILDENA